MRQAVLTSLAKRKQALAATLQQRQHQKVGGQPNRPWTMCQWCLVNHWTDWMPQPVALVVAAWAAGTLKQKRPHWPGAQPGSLRVKWLSYCSLRGYGPRIAKPWPAKQQGWQQQRPAAGHQGLVQACTCVLA